MLQEIENTLKCLKAGGVILYPTDTVWGLGCDAADSQAIARISAIKQRSGAKSMIVLVSDLNMLGRYFKNIPDVVFDLEENSDKPITYILENPVMVDKSLLHTDGTLGVRIPKHDFCRQLLKKFNKAIVSTSANLTGADTPVNFASLNKEIIKLVDYTVDPSLEKGATGKASTIIKINSKSEFEFIRK